MSFTDDLKRSLGFEETDSNKQRNGPGIIDSIRDVLKPKVNHNGQQNHPQHQYRSSPQQQYRPNPQAQYRPTHRTAPNPARPQPKPAPVYDDYDDYVIIPEQSFYEIVLIRPKTIDDINYIVDQVIEEKNPVIVDLSFLEKESAPNFKLAGDKIKQMRARYGAQALLLSRSEEKNLIIISPKKVKIINKG
jgi:SepF-like predicted cell division protein (DUF552 family)